MTKKEADVLIKELKTRHRTFGPWTFEFMYPGFFSYWHAFDKDLQVFFTPDFETKAPAVPVQVSRDGRVLETGEVPYTVRTGEALFAAVRPWLEKYRDGIREE